MTSQRELSEEVKHRLLRDISRKGGDVSARQMAQWVGNAAWCADQLCASPSSPIAALFWVRLYGTLHDVRAALRKHTEFNSKLGIVPDPRLVSCVTMIDEARSELSRAELLYVEYRRHVESHPFQDSYRLRLKKGGDLKDERTSTLVGVATLDEIDEAVEAIERQYDSSGENAAVAFAGRLQPLLDAAAHAVQRYCSPS